jgi:hypothetical protein
MYSTPCSVRLNCRAFISSAQPRLEIILLVSWRAVGGCAYILWIQECRADHPSWMSSHAQANQETHWSTRMDSFYDFILEFVCWWPTLCSFTISWWFPWQSASVMVQYSVAVGLFGCGSQKRFLSITRLPRFIHYSCLPNFKIKYHSPATALHCRYLAIIAIVEQIWRGR